MLGAALLAMLALVLLRTPADQVWAADWIEMPGLSGPVEERIPGGVLLELRGSGACIIHMDGQRLKARWQLRDNMIRIRGRDVDTGGSLEGDSLYLADVRGFGLYFSRVETAGR